MKKLTILGSTGSIGVSTLEVVTAQPDMFRVVALTAGSNLELLKRQIEAHAPDLVSVLTEENARTLKRMLTGKKPEILHGVEGMIAAATAAESTMVVAAIVGAAGLVPTAAAVLAGKDVALANKETLVTAGHLIMGMVHERGVKLYPVDSEHCAVFQSMVGHRNQDISRVILTASGGPFLNWSRERLASATVTDALNHPQVEQRVANQAALKIVELYPFMEYMKYLLPGSITLAMFVSVMIGGGMLYIDDKARGVHEGFLVTPITRLELVLGLVASGALKAILSGVVLTLLGSLIAGLDVIFHPVLLVQLALMIAATSFAFNALMFLLMVRVEDPLVPRAMFGILNTLLYFPSGAVYPIAAYPGWLRAIAAVDPFTYAVHGFKAVLLKDAGFAALGPDLLFLGLIGSLALVLATRLFKRTL